MFVLILKRIASVAAICAVLILVTLQLSRMSAMTPGRVALGPRASDDAITAYNGRVGFNAALPVRFVRYIVDMSQGDFGISARTQSSVSTDLASRWPATLELALSGLVVAAALGLLMGLVAALELPGHRLVRVIMTLAGSAPVFLAAFALLLILGSRLNVLPLTGRSNFSDAPSGPTGLLLVDGLVHFRLDVWWDALQHLTMPALSIALLPAVAIGRILTGSLTDVMRANHIKTARMKGLSPSRVVMKHGLRNASGPALAITGLQLGLMLSGVVIVEQVFGWPGVGNYVAEAIPANDFPVISAVTVVLGIAYVIINALVDLLQAWADPRIRSNV